MEDKIGRLRDAAAKLNTQVEEVNARLEAYEKLILECNPGEEVYLRPSPDRAKTEMLLQETGENPDHTKAWFIDAQRTARDIDDLELEGLLIPAWAKFERKWGLGAYWDKYPDGWFSEDYALVHWSRLSRLQRARLLLRVPSLMDAVAASADRLAERVEKLAKTCGVDHPAAKEGMQRLDVVAAVARRLVARKAGILQIHLDATEEEQRRRLAKIVGDDKLVKVGGGGGADIVAVEAGTAWIVEAVGTTSAQADEKLLKAIGRVLTRPFPPKAEHKWIEVRYALALPHGRASLRHEGSAWEAVAARILPPEKTKELKIHLLFVAQDGEVSHVVPGDSIK